MSTKESNNTSELAYMKVTRSGRLCMISDTSELADVKVDLSESYMFWQDMYAKHIGFAQAHADLQTAEFWKDICAKYTGFALEPPEAMAVEAYMNDCVFEFIMGDYLRRHKLRENLRSSSLRCWRKRVGMRHRLSRSRHRSL